MSDQVEFDSDMEGIPARRSAGMPSFQGAPDTGKGSGMAGWLIRNGFAKSQRGAQALLIVVVFIDIIAMFAIIKIFLL